MKFKPDFDSAAIEYQRAAVCCKNAEALEKSREMYLKAAEMHLSCGNLFHAAKFVSQNLQHLFSQAKLTVGDL
ncbi:unnamed protein product [Anisakis simplex]|uniref:Gamma-soluble NSF attachment protein (inferred by orthology to a human protein) n=1 Tax=Anisakis simplex TaxID=6269 RepID=A0A0M3JIU5_ANISI|nr:unnamed protein product [Anisakis simplex]